MPDIILQICTFFTFKGNTACNTSSGEVSFVLNSERKVKNRQFWNDCAPAVSRIRSYNILRGCHGLFNISDLSMLHDAFDLFINSTTVDEVIKCSNLEGLRIAATKQKSNEKN